MRAAGQVDAPNLTLRIDETGLFIIRPDRPELLSYTLFALPVATLNSLDPRVERWVATAGTEKFA